jgi:hypothetical protein
MPVPSQELENSLAAASPTDVAKKLVFLALQSDLGGDVSQEGKAATLAGAFHATGLHPFNRNAVDLVKLAPSLAHNNKRTRDDAQARDVRRRVEMGGAGGSSAHVLDRLQTGVSDGRVDLQIRRAHEARPSRADFGKPGTLAKDVDVLGLCADPASWLSPFERKLIETTRLQFLRNEALFLPHDPTKPVDMDIAEDDDAEDAQPRGLHHKKVTCARWLTSDDMLEAFKEKAEAMAAKEAGRGRGRGRGVARGEGGRGRGRGRGAAVSVISDDESGDETDEGSEASEEYLPSMIHNARTKGKVVEFEVEWEGFENSIDFTWEPEANLPGYASLVRDFIAEWKGVGKAWPPPTV